jgi:prolyl 4-hydroxylase
MASMPSNTAISNTIGMSLLAIATTLLLVPRFRPKINFPVNFQINFPINLPMNFPFPIKFPTLPTFGKPAPAISSQHHTFTPQIISVDPLLIYLHDFLSPSEIPALLAAAAPHFAPSRFVAPDGRGILSEARTSSSAICHDVAADPNVQRVLERALAFMGPFMPHGVAEYLDPPQLVRYAPGERFDEHVDWFEKPIKHDRYGSTALLGLESAPVPNRRRSEGDVTALMSGVGDGQLEEGYKGRDDRMTGKTWNRSASFLAILKDDCEGGETRFPRINVGDGLASKEAEGEGTGGRKKESFWREHEDGGIAFKPVKGNAIFWVNLKPDGKGDDRVLHAGMPVKSGVKTAMNIWPRVYYP